MKKIVSLILILCLASMLFVGCSTKTPAEQIAEALDKTQALDSMDAEMTMTVTVAAQGFTMEIPMTMDIKGEALQSDAPKMKIDMSMTMLEQTAKMEMYMEGDWAYYVMDGYKYKVKISELESEEDYSESVGSLLQDLPDDLLKDIELEEKSDGSKSVTIEIAADKFADLFEEIMEDMNSSTGTGTGAAEITDCSVTLTLKDGYITEYAMSYDMEMTVEGIAFTGSAEASISYKNPGTKVTVTPPEGYKDFEEMSGIG